MRPPEPAYPRRPTSFRRPDAARQELVEGELSPQQRRAREVRAEVRKIRIEPEAYLAALRDWAVNGAASRYALNARRNAAMKRSSSESGSTLMPAAASRPPPVSNCSHSAAAPRGCSSGARTLTT